jgi:hypothetical protein
VKAFFLPTQLKVKCFDLVPFAIIFLHVKHLYLNQSHQSRHGAASGCGPGSATLILKNNSAGISVWRIEW